MKFGKVEAVGKLKLK